jgi:RNA polymerase sigma-70 factor (ECF subfamily)
MNPESEERQWALAAQRGDRDAFSALVERHQRRVRACLAARMSDPHEAEDLAQEVFVTAYRRFAEYDPARPLAPWLRGIALNRLRNHWRKFRADAVGGNAELAELLDRQIAAECIAEREPLLHTALRECLERMDGPARELLQSRYGEEQSIRELSDRLGRGCSAITMQLHRLREILSDCIGRKLGMADKPA